MAGMRPGDVARLRSVGDPRVSPDGTLVAFAVVHVDVDADSYRSRIWLGPLDGSSAPRPLTSGEGRDGRPRWAPDGRVLAFTSHRGDEGCTLHVLPMGPGEVQTVLRWPEEIEELKWSPDGTHLAFLARERAERAPHDPPRRITRLGWRGEGVGWRHERLRRLFVVPADGSAPPRRVLDGDFEESGFDWSPDGTRFAVTSARHDDWDLDWAVDLWLVDIGGGEPTRLTDTRMAYDAPEWSPDGTRIAVERHDPSSPVGQVHIAVVEAASGAVEVVNEALDRPCLGPRWEGDEVLYRVEDSGNVHLYRGTSLVVGGDRTVESFDVGGAYVAATATTQAELFSSAGQLTTIGRALSEAVEVSAPQHFRVGDVDAWLVPPVGAVAGRRYPTLLNVHGGPFAQYGNRLFDEFQVQAGAGYAVLACNPRGSSGRGFAWGDAIRGRWGTVDYDDIMSVVDAAIERFDVVDPDRMGVLGGSYGGYMTTWIVSHTDRFKAACSERAANNLATMEHSSDISGWFARWEGRSHLDAAESLARQSPITYVKQITTPLLILHSEEDRRCPIAQAEELFVALRTLGRTVELVRFPGEGHELSRSGSPKHRIERFEIILDWFGRYL